MNIISHKQKSAALQLIILFGLVSLFGDIVYEGARSVNGQYLKTLGTSAAIVGFIVGIGEFLGYFIRFVFGYIADRKKAYWLFTFIGYLLIITVPMLSLTSTWQFIAILIALERIGKAIRSPARDAILSHATKQVGTGFGFGLHEAMDQIGAIVGPLIFAGLFMFTGHKKETISDYQFGYSFLWLPFILLVLCLGLAYIRVPHPEALEVSRPEAREAKQFSKVFWLYVIFTIITTVGFVNFVLIGYHCKAKGILSDTQIPFFYAIAMAIDGIVALLIGKIYDNLKDKAKNDKAGLFALAIIPVCSLFIPFLSFSFSPTLVIMSILIWGVVMGAHETIMRSAIADITPQDKRGTGYGIFNTGYGLAMFLGSFFMGLLYDYSIAWLIKITVAIEIVAILAFLKLGREVRLAT
jgi:MFS family permease